jgi:hypothetical protein
VYDKSIVPVLRLLMISTSQLQLGRGIHNISNKVDTFERQLQQLQYLPPVRVLEHHVKHSSSHTVKVFDYRPIHSLRLSFLFAGSSPVGSKYMWKPADMHPVSVEIQTVRKTEPVICETYVCWRLI